MKTISEKTRNKLRPVLKELLACAATAAVPVLLFTAFIVPARISGGSMLPGLADGDMIFCWRHGDVSRGDVVLLDAPDGRVLVKRVVGLPGDEVSLDDGGLHVNGHDVQEPYCMDAEDGHGPDAGPCTVPEGSVFVLGDNRASSRDSRDASVGFVPLDGILGRLAWKAGW